MGLFGINASAQDTYEITCAEDLMAFADLVNGGETTANAVAAASSVAVSKMQHRWAHTSM